jgi:hypothetical protein
LSSLSAKILTPTAVPAHISGNNLVIEENLFVTVSVTFDTGGFIGGGIYLFVIVNIINNFNSYF